MRIRILIMMFTIALTAASIVERTARAQSTLEVPGPAQQSQPNVAPPRQAPPPVMPAPDNGDSIQLIPPQLWNSLVRPQPQPAAPPPAPMTTRPMTLQANPVLPAEFRGCWDGQVNQLEWIKREPGAQKIGYWTPKTYRLCYKRVGDGPFTLTFTQTGVEPNDRIINPHGNVALISSDGRKFASLSSHLHFDEYGRGYNPDSATFAVDENTRLDCRIDGDEMKAEIVAQVLLNFLELVLAENSVVDENAGETRFA